MPLKKTEREAIIIDTGVETNESVRPLDVDEIIKVLTEGDNTVILSRTDDPADNVEVRYRDKPDPTDKPLLN